MNITLTSSYASLFLTSVIIELNLLTQLPKDRYVNAAITTLRDTYKARIYTGWNKKKITR